MNRIMDDTLTYEKTIAAQFYQICKTLELGNNNSTIFNSMKFQFCGKELSTQD